MRTKTWQLIVIIPGLALGACADKASSSTGGTGTQTDRKPTAGATRVAGDIVPVALHPVALGPSEPQPLLTGSDPAPSATTFEVAHMPERGTTHDFMRIVSPGSAPDALVLPIDTPEGAVIVITAAAEFDTGKALLGQVHLRSVATNEQVDAARGGTNPKTPGVEDVQKAETIELAKREPGLAPLIMAPRRTFSVAKLAGPGLVYVDAPAALLAEGIAIEVQQPKSTILMGQLSQDHMVAAGAVATIHFDVTDADGAIADATIAGSIEPPGARGKQPVTFTQAAPGVFEAAIPMNGAELTDVGSWSVTAKIMGHTADGRAFERDAESGFQYVVPHAQMTGVSAAHVVRGKDDLVDGVTIDVDVQSVSADRMVLHGTLTAMGKDGVEHAIATSQTGMDVTPGTTTMTLHFTSGAMFLANLDGPYHLRDLALTSVGTATTQHRLGLGLEVATPAMSAKALRPAEKLPESVEESLNLGSL